MIIKIITVPETEGYRRTAVAAASEGHAHAVLDVARLEPALKP